MSASQIAALEHENARLLSALEQSNAALAELQADYQMLKQQIEWFKRQLYRVHGQGGTGQHSQRTVGQRQHPLGVQVAIVQIGDEGSQIVFAKYVSGFHYPPSEAKADILFPIPALRKSEVQFAVKSRGKYSS